MNSADFKVSQSKVALRRLPTRVKAAFKSKGQYRKMLQAHVEQLSSLQQLSLCLSRDRYRSIVELEEHLHRNGTLIIKFFLNLSKREQEKRFLEALMKRTKTGNSAPPT